MRTYFTALSEYEWETTNISERSCSPLPILMSSDSMNARPEKHQQVPDMYWFLIEVIGSSLMVVN